jgi:hypothetical protein
MKKAIIFSLATILSAPAFAGGTWTNVTVSTIQPCTAQGCGQIVLVWLSANSTGTPSCANGQAAKVAIDVSTSSGAYSAAVMQSARLSGTVLPSISGAGSCAVYSGVESLYSLQE